MRGCSLQVFCGHVMGMHLLGSTANSSVRPRGSSSFVVGVGWTAQGGVGAPVPAPPQILPQLSRIKDKALS